MRGFSKSYKSIKRKIANYWKIYGGFSEFVRSPYVHISLLLTVISTNTWLNHEWWKTVFSIQPNLIGFTLGGFAIFLSLGDEKFKAVIAGTVQEEENRHSPYMGITSTFLHFIIVQIVALLLALAAEALHFDLPWPLISSIFSPVGMLADFIGYWIFLYGICLSMAAAIAIFDVATWYEGYQTNRRASPQPDDVPCSKCPLIDNRSSTISDAPKTQPHQ